MSGLQRPSGLKQPSKIGKGVANSTSRTPNESEKNFGDFSHSYALASAIFTVDDWPMRKKISDASLVLTENTDDFIIGDRVWVGGTKGGYIQYIGETQFAPGDWAGVVLDDPVGKNDGAVAGVRYYTCEAKRGVFSRLTKLSREPIQHLIDEERDAEAAARANGSSSGRNSPLLQRASSPVASLSNAGRRYDSTSSPRGSTSNLSMGEGPLRVGVRVLVQSANGSKMGVLRYLGTTDFASGEWAGIELDEAIGKNDGSVAGRRYFTCKSKYGLFAPTHKVNRIPSTPVAKRVGTTTRPTLVSGLARRTGSHESLNSSLSSASNTARAARVRLGVTSLSSQKSPLKSSVRTSLGASQNPMQEALKEKEQHIEQLLKERDMERAEVAKAAVQVEECERKLNSMKNEHQTQIEDAEKRLGRFRSIAENVEQQRKELVLQLEEEKRKVEDLQFRVEEESISKGDLETATAADAEKIKHLESCLEDEKKRYLVAELNLKKTQDVNNKLKGHALMFIQTQDVISKLKEQMELMKSQMRLSENNLRQLQSTKEEVGERASLTAVELSRKEKKILALEEDLEMRNKEINELKREIKKLEESLDDKIRNSEKLQFLVDSLHARCDVNDGETKRFQQELKTLKLNYSDVERKLVASEQRLEQANKQKGKLEQDIADLMKNKGSNSEQLSKMNEELRLRENALDDLQSKLQHSSQQVAKLQDTLEHVKQQAKMESEQENSRHKDHADVLNCQIQNLTTELTRTQTKMQQKSQLHDTELEQYSQKKNAEIKELKCEIESRDSQIGMLTHQLADVRRHVQDLAQRNIQETQVLDETLETIRTENDALKRDKDKLNTSVEQLESKIQQLEAENQKLRAQHNQNETAVKDRDAKLIELTAETERLRLEFGKHRVELKKKLAENQLEEQAMHDMRHQIEMQCKVIDKLQTSLIQTEKEKDDLEETVKKYDTLQAQNTQLESTAGGLKHQIREMKHKLNEVESERALLQKKLTIHETKLQQKDDEHKKQLSKVVVDKKNDQTQVLEQEKLQLNNKIVELQVALERSKENASMTGSVVDVYKEEKLAVEGQVEFLNSVIVDMQKKNDLLQAKIQALESPSTGDEINLNGIQIPVVLPRLFCDICDVFDLHDTEDCPRQASDSPPSSQNHGNRNQVRPYCDICEVFGHWTNQCKDDEMF